MKVGDKVALVSKRLRRVINTFTIDRETPKFWWLGSHRYRKSDGAQVPDYIDEWRAIVTLEEAAKMKGRAS